MVIYLILLLSSCKHDVIEGTVIEKTYEPSSTYIVMIPVRVNGRASMTPATRYRSARYILKICCTQGDGTDTIITVRVSSEEYAEIEVGDYYTNNKEGKE